MTQEEMRRLMLHSVWDDRSGVMFLPSEMEYIPYHRHEGERFAIFDHCKEREIIRPTFFESNYDELLRLAQLVRFPWSDEAHRLMDTPSMEDTELTAEDTKELDEFLCSFSRT